MIRSAPILLAACLATPTAAEEGPSLLERGAEMFLEGLLQEIEPALDEMQQFAERAGPAMRDFLKTMGPMLGDVLDQVEDWSVYEAPEILDNGDIIIRRKPDRPEPLPDAEDQIEI